MTPMLARAGNGNAVFLLHGFCGAAADWQPTIAALSRHFDVIAPDLPGFGLRASAPPCRTIAEMAREVLSLADSLRINRFSVVGHSISGFIVQQLLIDAPQRIEKAVLYGAALAIDHAKRFESIPDTIERLQRDGVEATVRRVVATWFVEGDKHPCYPETVAAGARMSLDAATDAMGVVMEANYTNRLGAVRSPCLVVLGEHDRTFSPEMALQLHRSLPRSSLCILPAAAHAAHLERADLFNAIVRDFLLESRDEA